MTVYQTIMNRRTTRKFLQKPIEKDHLLKYIDVARLAPSGGNLQPLKYFIVNSKEKVVELFTHVRWATYLAPNYNPADNEKPVAFIAIINDMNIAKSGYEMSVGAAVQNISLSAEEDGVGCCWMCAIDYVKISALLNLEENLKLICVVALGYKAEYPKIVDMDKDGVKYYLDEYDVLNIIKDVLIK